MSKTITIRQEQKGCYSAIRVDVADFADFVQRMSSLPIDAIFPSAWVKAGLLVMGDHGVHVLTPRGEDLLASAHLIPDDPKPEQPSATPCEACNGTGEQMLLVSTHVCDVCHGSKVKPDTLTRNPCRDMPAPRLGRVSGDPRVLDSLGFNPPYATNVESGRVSSTRPDTASLPRLGYSVVISVESDGTRVKTEHLPDGRVLRCRENSTGRWVVDSVTALESPSPEPSPWVLIDSEAVARSFVGKRVEIDATKSVTDDIAEAHGCTCTLTNVSSERLYFNRYSLRWRERGNVRLRVVGGSDV